MRIRLFYLSLWDSSESDSFDIRREELTQQFQNPDNEYFLDPEDFGGSESDEYQEEWEALTGKNWECRH